MFAFLTLDLAIPSNSALRYATSPYLAETFRVTLPASSRLHDYRR